MGAFKDTGKLKWTIYYLILRLYHLLSVYLVKREVPLSTDFNVYILLNHTKLPFL